MVTISFNETGINPAVNPVKIVVAPRVMVIAETVPPLTISVPCAGAVNDEGEAATVAAAMGRAPDSRELNQRCHTGVTYPVPALTVVSGCALDGSGPLMTHSAGY